MPPQLSMMANPDVTIVTTSAPRAVTTQSWLGVADRIRGQVGQCAGQIVGRTEHRQPVVVLGRSTSRRTPRARSRCHRRLRIATSLDQLGQRHHRQRSGSARGPWYAGEREQIVHQHAHPRHCGSRMDIARGTSLITPSSRPSGQARQTSHWRRTQVVGHEARPAPGGTDSAARCASSGLGKRLDGFRPGRPAPGPAPAAAAAASTECGRPLMVIRRRVRARACVQAPAPTRRDAREIRRTTSQAAERQPAAGDTSQVRSRSPTKS